MIICKQYGGNTMAQTEITVQIFEDIKNVVKKIESMGYSWQDTFTGVDKYFTTMSGSDMKKAGYKQLLDSSIIVREFDKKKSGSHQVSMVHKKKTIDASGRVVGEDKSSVAVASGDDTSRVLASAGLTNWMTLSQQNNFYINGEKTIIVGTVQGLPGTFVEIEEYNSIKDKPEKEKFDILTDFVNSLGFRTGGDYSCKKIYMLYEKSLESQKSKESM